MTRATLLTITTPTGTPVAGDPGFVVSDFDAPQVRVTDLSVTRGDGVFETIAVIDGRTDIYSLGVILYELLCGERVFTSSNYLGMVTQHLVAAPVPPSVRNGAIPPALDALVLRALEKDPGQRFPSMRFTRKFWEFYLSMIMRGKELYFELEVVK